MTPRIMGRLQRRQTEHTTWCTRDHRCGVDEHRSADLIADSIGGRAVVTRVRAGEVEYAEVRARIPLHASEAGARWQLGTVLDLMRELLAAVAIRPGVLRAPADRPAVDGRRAVTRR